MYQGAQAAGGRWLLFTDADTVHTPLTLSSTVAYAIEHDIDLLSIMPRSDLGSPIERLVMPIAFLGIVAFFPPFRVNDPTSSIATANGQFILVRREVYDAVGGVERVKSMISEDLEFAKAVKGDGYRLHLADGRHLLSVRMYTNLREVWEGWSKNLVLSFRENPLMGALTFIGLLLLITSPTLFPVWAARAWKRAASESGADRLAFGWLAALLTFTAAVPLVYRRRIDYLLGLPPGWTLTQPVGAAVVGIILLYSLVRLVTGKGVVWKGRTYEERSE
jgi:chlorobactene glucosyltransferase